MYQAMRAVRNDQLMARAASSVIATRSTLMNGIGGPQTNEERPADVAKENPQSVRISGANWRCQKHVSATNKLKIPHSTCVTVSTFWPTVRE